MVHGMFWHEGDPVLLQDASIWAVRGFEVFVLIAFVATVLWAPRKRDAVLTGAFFACTLPMLFWDWIQNQPSQFRLVYDDRFIHAFRITDGPGYGPGEPWFLAATYSPHFVPTAWQIVASNEMLSRRLGAFKWPGLFFVCDAAELH
jgi:4-amino-4-deoxy-L-arabinose transferase-like glycosyltransferase